MSLRSSSDSSSDAPATHPCTPMAAATRAHIQESLLRWFARNQRDFPWRHASSPYAIAVAEIMLQKTSATNVQPIFEHFLRRYPTVEDLAAADPSLIAELLHPLGLPRRAHLLTSLARVIVSKFGGQFPSSEAELRKLPGLGPYGAGAVACLGFGARAAMIDINVMRIFERAWSIKATPRSGPSRQLRTAVMNLMPHTAGAEFNLALLDLGATVCRVRDPQCDICPLASVCEYNQTRGRRAGDV